MHNLHFVTVTAKTAKEACKTVENFISEYGNENNWRTICGCVSEKNEVYDNPDKNYGGRYKPSELGYTTIAKINNVVKGWFKNDMYTEAAQTKLAKGQTNLKRWTSSDLWLLKKLADFEYQLKGIKNKGKFNVLTDEFYSYEYAEYGVTQCGENESGTKFVVFVDMHD